MLYFYLLQKRHREDRGPEGTVSTLSQAYADISSWSALRTAF